MNAIDKKDVENFVTYARQVSRVFPLTGVMRENPQLLFSAEDESVVGLASAHVNYEQRVPGWCKCQPEGEQVYFRNKDTGSHGWMCATCRRITQMG